MAYPTNLLQPDEEVVLELNPHWKYLFWPTLILVLSIIGGLFVLNQERVVQVPLGLVVLIALGWFIKRFILWRTTTFILTTDRCIYRSGALVTSGVEMPLEPHQHRVLPADPVRADAGRRRPGHRVGR